MTRTEILPEMTPEIIPLKFARTENNPTELNSNGRFFSYIIFLFKKSLLDQKSTNPSWPDLKSNSNRIMLTQNNPTRS